MKVASYNHMFGCSGRSLSDFLYVHILHAFKKYKNIEKIAQLDQTLKTLQESDADIVGISEVLGKKQREKLIKALRTIGYTHFHTGTGHGLRGYGAVETLLATRLPSKSFFAPEFSVPDIYGYGGGIVGAFIPHYDVHIIQLHLPWRKNTFHIQLKTVFDEVRKIRADRPHSKIIIMGDFNCRYKDLLSAFPEFFLFKKLSRDTVTYSTTNFLRRLDRRDLDHIFGVGLEAHTAGTRKGLSDHLLVWANITP